MAQKNKKYIVTTMKGSLDLTAVLNGDKILDNIISKYDVNKPKNNIGLSDIFLFNMIKREDTENKRKMNTRFFTLEKLSFTGKSAGVFKKSALRKRKSTKI
jgi:hypothetical protein